MAATLRDRLRKQLAALDAVEEGGGIFDVDEPGYFVNGRLVAEFAAPNTIQLRLTKPIVRACKTELKDDARVDPIRSSSDWITVHFRRAGDLELIVSLLARAVPLYLPPPGQPVKPPPTGADLERRRRFH